MEHTVQQQKAARWTARSSSLIHIRAVARAHMHPNKIFKRDLKKVTGFIYTGWSAPAQATEPTMVDGSATVCKLCEGDPAGSHSWQGSEPGRGESENSIQFGIINLDQTSGSLVPGGYCQHSLNPV